MTLPDPSAHKNDIKTMLAHCTHHEREYWSQKTQIRLCAPPYCFERAAILLRKMGEYSLEVEICERWIAIAIDYSDQPEAISGRVAPVHQGPRSAAIFSRLDKAKELSNSKPPLPDP